MIKKYIKIYFPCNQTTCAHKKGKKGLFEKRDLTFNAF